MRVEVVKTTGDNLILDAARASFDRQAKDYSLERNKGLMNFLVREDHWTPLAHVRMRFKSFYCPIKGVLTPEQSAGYEFINNDDVVENSLWGWYKLYLDGNMEEDMARTFIHTVNNSEELKIVASVLNLPETEPSSNAKFIGFGDSLTLRITCPIFVARQFFKHTIRFIYSEASGRYITYTDAFMPYTWLSAPDNKKQGSGEPVGIIKQILASALTALSYKVSYTTYNLLMKLGIAPEQARVVVPLATNTTFVVTSDQEGWARFLKQRLAGDAQTEIRILAKAIDKQVSIKYLTR